ncbi:hypothetical protein [Micromonospora aurantiaca (nom. illeg.)]
MTGLDALRAEHPGASWHTPGSDGSDRWSGGRYVALGTRPASGAR